MDWVILILVIISIWVLFDVANKLHTVEKDLEVIKSQLQRMEDRKNA